MYQGRHCQYTDYQLLENTSQKFLQIINLDNFVINEVEKYLSTFSDFDFNLSSKIRIYLNKIDDNKIGVINKITHLLDELKNNVLVDIREHN